VHLLSLGRARDTQLDGLCNYGDLPLLTIVRDRDLTPGGTFWSCDD